METSSSITRLNGEIVGDNSKHMKISLLEEIVTDIISRLPVKPVFQSQCLSKYFSSITNNSNFIESHLKHSNRLRPSIIIRRKSTIYLIRSGEIDSKVIVEEVPLPKNIDSTNPRKIFCFVGSCNGLIVATYLFTDLLNDDCFLLNPSIGKCNSLPRPNRPPGPGRRFASACWGFGFCVESSVYKIVRIVYYHTVVSYISTYDKPLVEVLTYGVDSVWRKLDFSKFDEKFDGHGVTVKGVVYWKPIKNKHNDNKLLTFKLEKEEFSWIFCPVNGKIMKFRESLAVCVESQIDKKAFDIWVLRDDDHCVTHAANEYSWEKVYTTDKIFPFQPLLCLNDTHLLLHKRAKFRVKSFSLYDMESKKIKRIIKLSTCNSGFEALNFVESIVPLAWGGDSEYNSNDASCVRSGVV